MVYIWFWHILLQYITVFVNLNVHVCHISLFYFEIHSNSRLILLEIVLIHLTFYITNVAK